MMLDTFGNAKLKYSNLAPGDENENYLKESACEYYEVGH